MKAVTNRSAMAYWAATAHLLASALAVAQSLELNYMPIDGMAFEITERTTRVITPAGADPVTDTRERKSRMIVDRTPGGYANTVTIASHALERNGTPVFSPVLPALEGLTLTYRLSPAGALLEIDGYEQVREALSSRLPEGLAGPLLELLSIDSLRQQDTASYNEVYGDFTGGMIRTGGATLAIVRHELPLDGAVPVYSLTVSTEADDRRILVTRHFNSDGTALAAQFESVTEEALVSLDTTLAGQLPDGYATVSVSGSEQTLLEPVGALVVSRTGSFEYLFAETAPPRPADGPADESPPPSLTVRVTSEFTADPVLAQPADPVPGQPAVLAVPHDPPADTGTLTAGLAAETFACGNLVRACTGPARRFVEARCGIVTASGGESFQVPVVPADGPDPTDLFNDCSGDGDNASYLDDLVTVEIDPDGEEVTGYLFADNYFELYVNGAIVARDPIGFVPFNSSVVRFKATRPLVYGVKLVDWGTHLGVGMEYDRWNVGDGGFIARFADGTVTGSDWKCRAYYVSPLDDASCVEAGPDSSACPERSACADSDPTTCKALHFRVPEDWASPDFDDSDWLPAATYRADQVTNQPAYRDYADKFGEADFIWSRNLDQDNLVLCRGRSPVAE